MRISGAGTLPKSNIKDKVVSSGSVRMEGDLECLGFRSSGSARGDGDLMLRGDENARSSGSASIEKGIEIRGKLTNSGSLRVGSGVEALLGVTFSGSSRVDGDLTSEETVEITGSTTVKGNIKAKEVFIGEQTRSSGKLPYKVFGNIFAANDLKLNKTFVKGDVRGRNVKIGKKSEIMGNIYYIDTIEIDPKASIVPEPIQISEINENELEK